MSQNLYRVVYASRNLIGGTDPQQHQEIAQILRTARANNSRKNVTGALLYNAGYFAQVLEGPRPSVEEIFEHIQRDGRHSDITVLEGEGTDQRDFPDWSMAHVQPASQSQSSGIGETIHHAISDPEASGHGVLMLMRSLVVQED